MNMIVNKEPLDKQADAYKLSYPIEIVEHPTSPFYKAEDTSVEESPVEDIFTVATEAETVQNTEDSEAEEASDYPINVSSDSIGPDELVLRLSKDSWIEVFDAMENKVFLLQLAVHKIA